MADKMGLSKIEIFPKSAMRLSAARHITIFKKRVQGGLDYQGKRFKIYTNKYMTLKSNKFVSEKTGKRYKYPRAPIASNQIFPPDLTLTGAMLRNLRRRSYSKTDYVIGFDGESAEKVDGHQNRGRNIVDNIPNKEKAFIVKLLGQNIDRQFKKLKNITITVGK